jgi:formyltetrahydrofolate deformylase
MRLRFTLGDFASRRESLHDAVTALLADHAPQVELRFSDAPRRVAILVSKQGHCLYDLLQRRQSGELPCSVTLVASNHPDLEPVAEHFGVPFRHLPVGKESKLEQEVELHAAIRAAKADLVVLARYMQILSAGFVDKYPARMINIHHSFLPAFRGARPYHQAYRLGVKLIGATSHYVTAELDEGPIIEQDVVRVSHRDSVAELHRRGRDLETVVLARAVRWHLEDRVLLAGNKTVVFS